MIDKEEFDSQVIAYQKMHLFTVKTQAYKNGFADGVSLARSIEESITQPHAEADADKPCPACSGKPNVYCHYCGLSHTP